MSYPGYELNQYQREALRTANTTKGKEVDLAVNALGIAGEAGEVADLFKKHVGHDHPLDTEKAAKELGDVLWYVAVLAQRIGWTLGEVAEANIEKLRKRHPDGFSSEASKNRKA